MKNSHTTMLLVALITLMLAVDAQAVLRFVSTSGNDTGNDCTIGSSPCHTIQNAVNHWEDGDIILVAQGQYKENVSMSWSYTVNKTFYFNIMGGWSNDFSSLSNDPAKTVIDGGAADTVLNISSASEDIDLTVQYFTLTNGDGISGGGVAVNNSGATMKVSFKNNIITRNKAQTGAGLYVRTPSGKTEVALTNNMITDNEASSEGGGIYAEAGWYYETEMTLTNNTIAGNYGDSRGGGISIYSHQGGLMTLKLVNNIIWANSTNPTWGSGDDVHYWEDDTSADSSTTIEAWYTDPLFVNAARGNYHIRSKSPAVDAGWCGTLNYDLSYTRVAPYDDFEGDSRPGDIAFFGCDLGADEYVAKQTAMPWLLLLNE
ncbi:MAG: DUF1565 domain-containing protein [Deltaproteobacteria bacterium]|nr:DUF1565 domain-containing protein [Deltaproteobacteria bacterium]